MDKSLDGGKNSFTCTFCDYKMNNKTNYYKHARTMKHQTRIEDAIESYNCANLDSMLHKLSIIRDELR